MLVKIGSTKWAETKNIATITRTGIDDGMVITMVTGENILLTTLEEDLPYAKPMSLEEFETNMLPKLSGKMNEQTKEILQEILRGVVESL